MLSQPNANRVRSLRNLSHPISICLDKQCQRKPINCENASIDSHVNGFTSHSRGQSIVTCSLRFAIGRTVFRCLFKEFACLRRGMASKSHRLPFWSRKIPCFWTLFPAFAVLYITNPLFLDCIYVPGNAVSRGLHLVLWPHQSDYCQQVQVLFL